MTALSTPINQARKATPSVISTTSPATAAAIKSGYVDLVGDGQPFLQGYLPVMQIVLSKKYGFSGLNIETGAGFVHKGNIDLIAPLAKKGLR